MPKRIMYGKLLHKLGCVLLYTALFVLLCSILYGYVSGQGKVLIESFDGLEIRYPAAEYSRRAFGDFLSGLEVREWDWSIGYGANPLTDLTGLAELNDPFYIIFTIFGRATPGLFALATFLRVYVAGLAFLYFCRVRSFSQLPSLAACMVYICSPFVTMFTVKHPVFALPMIALPIIWAGIERALQGRPPYALALGVCFSACTCLYFFYIIVIFTIIYTFARHIQLAEKGAFFKKLWPLLGRILLWSGVGVLASAVLLVPQMLGIFTSSRSGEPAYQVGYRPSPFTAYGLHWWAEKIRFSAMTMVQFVSATLLSFAWMVLAKENRRHHKDDIIMLLGVTAIVCSTHALSALNGFAKPTYRWWVCGSIIAPIAFANLFTRRPLPKLRELLIPLAVAGLIFWRGDYTSTPYPHKHTLVLTIGLAAVLAAAALLQGKYSEKTERLRLLSGAAGLIVMVASVFYYNRYTYHADLRNYVKQLVTPEQVAEFDPSDPAVSLYTDIDDDGFYRVDTQYAPMIPVTNDAVRDNSSLYFGQRGLRTSKSIVDKNMWAFYENNHIRNMNNGCEIGSLDERAALLSMAGVKYYAATKGSGLPLPYGYTFIKDNGGYESLYRNKYDVGIGYVVNNYMLESDMLDLHPVQRQIAQLASVVLEQPPESDIARSIPKVDMQTIAYSIETADGLDLSGDGMQADIDGGSAMLAFQPVQDAELYVYLPGAEYYPDNKAYQFTGVGCRKTDVGGNKYYKRITYKTIYHQYYTEQQADLINMGYCDQSANQLKLTMDYAGRLSFDGMELLALDMKAYDEYMQAAQSNRLQDVSFGDEEVTGKIDLDEDGILFLSVPYNDGWSATVNGEKAKLLKANTGFCAIELSAGDNEIHLSYSTPYSGISAAASLGGVTVFCGLWTHERRLKKAKREETENG